MNHLWNRRRGFALLLVPVGAAACIAGIFLLSHDGVQRRPSDSLTIARRLLDDGRIVDARKLFEAQLNENPNSVAAVRGLFACARDASDDEAAIRWARRWTELEPKSALAWKSLAVHLDRAGRSLEALAAAQTAMGLATEPDPVLSALATRLLSNATRDPLGSPKRDDFDPSSMMKHPKAPDPMRHLPQPGRAK